MCLCLCLCVCVCVCVCVCDSTNLLSLLNKSASLFLCHSGSLFCILYDLLPVQPVWTLSVIDQVLAEAHPMYTSAMLQMRLQKVYTPL